MMLSPIFARNCVLEAAYTEERERVLWTGVENAAGQAEGGCDRTAGTRQGGDRRRGPRLCKLFISHHARQSAERRTSPPSINCARTRPHATVVIFRTNRGIASGHGSTRR